MRVLMICIGLMLTLNTYADLSQPSAHGFHWYSLEAIETIDKPKPPANASLTLSPYEKLMAIRQTTLNKLSTALITPSFEATHEYMQAQMQYAKNNQAFVRYWQQVLLLYPELDHTLNFPTDNSAVAIRNDATNQLIERVVREGAQQYGLILFYRGNSSVSQKFVSVLAPFVQDANFSMISVATDGQPIQGLPNPKSITLTDVQKTLDIQERYMPALFLVNFKTQQMSPLSYGFVSLSELKQRLLDVATNYKRFSYEGLAE